MAVKVLKGDLFGSSAQTLVNTVNCVGIMGKGVALQFKKRFPAMFLDYEKRCARGEVQLGKPYLWKPLVGQWVLNFPTKDHWRSVSKLDNIRAGLQYLKAHYREWGIESLAVPPLGCGQGGLEWLVVGSELYRGLSELDIPVELYAPAAAPPEHLDPTVLGRAPNADPATGESIRVPRIQPSWLAIVEILHRIERERYRYPVGRITFQKIAYFATACGIPTGLDYGKGQFGPFAKGLKPILTQLANNGLVHEARTDQFFEVRVGNTFTDARHSYVGALKPWEGTIERVADLFLRLRTNTRDPELIASVHFVAEELEGKSGRKHSENEVFAVVKEWKLERARDEEIGRAVRLLNLLGWVSLVPSRDLPLPKAETDLKLEDGDLDDDIEEPPPSSPPS